MRIRSRFVELGELSLAAALVACGFDSSGSGTGASLSVGEEDGPSGEAVGDDVADDATADGSEADDVDGDGSSGPPGDACGDGGNCGAAAPQGWTGPFALSSASPPDASLVCPQGWMQQAMGGQDLIAPGATCGCDCAPGGGMCSVSVTYYSDSGCSSSVETAVSDGGCANLDTGSAHGYAIASGMAAGTSCTPMATSAVPPTTWNTGVVLCAPPAMDACADGPCLPATPTGFDGRWCVMAEGEQGCPAGEYSQATIVHRNTVDTRACSPCTCDEPGAATCPGALHVYLLPACTLVSGDITVDGACAPAPWDGEDGYWSVAYDGAPPSYACGGPGVSPIGEATPSEPFTMCCTP